MGKMIVEAYDGRKLSVEEWGDPRGRPIFLLHGTPGSRHGPRPRPTRLHGLRIRLIAYDRPGYGDSDRLRGRRIAHAAEDVAAIADALGIDRMAVVGRSGGAAHALACAARMPDRVIRVASLAGLAPRDAEGLDWYADMDPSNVAAFTIAERGLEALEQLIAPRADAIRADPVAHLPFAVEDLPVSDLAVISNPRIRDMLSANFAEALKVSAEGWIDDVLSLVSPWDFDPALIRAPVLIWRGGRDALTPPRHANWLADRIETSTLRSRDDAGHFGALEVLPDALHWLGSGPDDPV